MERGPLGAQTGRRGGAGPAGGSLGGKDPTGRLVFLVQRLVRIIEPITANYL
jgi:hypothetical protein